MSPRTRMATAGALALAIPLVASFEGRRESAYLDPVGIPTICYGSTAGVRLGQTLTRAECDALLAGELGQVLSSVDALVQVPMPDTRRAALASFVYNVGSAAFRRSRVLRHLNAGRTAAACAELSRWVYAGGNRLPGLVKRRAAERELCEVGL